MSIQFRSFVFVSLSLLAACGDEAQKAQDKCESLVTRYCDRVVSCAQQADLLGSDFSARDLRAECEGFMRDDAHCEDAIDVSDEFGQCTGQAASLSCANVTAALETSSDLYDRYIEPLPNSCLDAVIYAE